MIQLIQENIMIRQGIPTILSDKNLLETGKKKTIAHQILKKHAVSDENNELQIRFDALISHDITYVGIIQTAKASGLKEFPLPYVLTNCHNSLCAVGGTINEDDHVFGLSAARKYGGIYVPANLAVIHQYAREELSGCGKMILGSDSHTRYGALGTMGIGEGGPELVKQLLQRTYDIATPEIVLVYLTGKPKKGVGPHDVAIALCGATYKNKFVKNKVLEFAGPGVASLPMDFRIGIDVMTTETACLSSIWETDEKVESYLSIHGRKDAYKKLSLEEGACYDSMIAIDLSTIEPMVALPFHPSEAYTIHEFQENPGDILREAEKRGTFGNIPLHWTDKIKNGKLFVDQGIIAGCAGGMYDNIAEASQILKNKTVGNGYFTMSVYPSSVPVNLELLSSGVQMELLKSGAIFKPCFCGPCFGAGDVPNCGALSIRHTTRNFPNREGSKPADGQMAGVMLMDARSIAATAANHGQITAATDVEYEDLPEHENFYDTASYQSRIYQGFGKPMADEELKFGPNITPWPSIPALGENLLLRLDAVIHDSVTTTDELIPSGDASSYRSNPMKLATFTLSRRVPEYVQRVKDTMQLSKQDLQDLCKLLKLEDKEVQIASTIFANKPGDGSAREQAASCQRVLGGAANLCHEFATKRYRSNCINWGLLPLQIEDAEEFHYTPGDFVYIPEVRKNLLSGKQNFMAQVIHEGKLYELPLHMEPLTEEERQILLDGCLMNYYAKSLKEN